MTNCFKKIMIIDDDSIDRYILKRILAKENMALEIIESSTASEALNMLMDCSIKELPELIFLDVNIPAINGFEFLNALKQLKGEYNRKCLIVMTSAFINESEKNQATLHDNVIGYIEKPLQEEIFLKLRKHLLVSKAS
jgi:CheY-like chemotaxis protein